MECERIVYTYSGSDNNRIQGTLTTCTESRWSWQLWGRGATKQELSVKSCWVIVAIVSTFFCCYSTISYDVKALDTAMKYQLHLHSLHIWFNQSFWNSSDFKQLDQLAFSISRAVLMRINWVSIRFFEGLNIRFIQNLTRLNLIKHNVLDMSRMYAQ